MNGFQLRSTRKQLSSFRPVESPLLRMNFSPSSTRLQATLSTTPSDSEARANRKTLKKILPLGAMLFFILFNYTILRDTKDVLVVTAPNSGAEIIPFLKTYVNLPSAIGFTVLYSTLCNKMPSDKVFFLVMSAFLSFFGAFAGRSYLINLSCNNLICIYYFLLFRDYLS